MPQLNFFPKQTTHSFLLKSQKLVLAFILTFAFVATIYAQSPANSYTYIGGAGLLKVVSATDNTVPTIGGVTGDFYQQRILLNSLVSQSACYFPQPYLAKQGEKLLFRFDSGTQVLPTDFSIELRRGTQVLARVSAAELLVSNAGKTIEVGVELPNGASIDNFLLLGKKTSQSSLPEAANMKVRVITLPVDAAISTTTNH
jgi:hypothetical protein